MLARLLAGFAVTAAVLAPATEAARADLLSEEILSGGRPRAAVPTATARSSAAPARGSSASAGRASVPTTASLDSSAGGNWFSRLFSISSVPRTMVSFPSREAPGTIIINTNERRLYLLTGHGQAMRYGIGVGRDGFTWAGVTQISAKREWPDWTPPPEMLKRRPDLPHHMKGGLDNPLGARAMYLGSTLFRIHGTNESETIGTASSSGCFRLTNDDVIDLYNRVRIGTKVIVLR